MFSPPNNLERRSSSHRYMLSPGTRTHNAWQIVSIALFSSSFKAFSWSLRIDNKICLLRLTKMKSWRHSTYQYEQVRLLTNNVAFINGTCTPSDFDRDLIPPALKPIIVPAQVMLLPSKTRWSLRTPFVTIVTDVDKRCATVQNVSSSLKKIINHY